MPNPRKLLFPFSVLYHGVTEVRNKLYDHNILESRSYDLPVIGVGNLNMGGTGKSPMIEYLLKILQKDYKLATLSRGYKRESKGFQLVNLKDPASKAGDEPLQFKNNYPDTIVAVDANRQEGIRYLLKHSPDVILLDDVFQHRKVSAGYYILLTAYGDLYTDDLVLPAGNLRESARGAERADVIVVTKCPFGIDESEMADITRKLNPKPNQKVYFTSINYSERIISEKGEKPISELQNSDFRLVTGIANPQPLIEHLALKGIQLKHLKFPDHHNFTEKEIETLRNEPFILTTEKDYMRLRDRLPADKLFYLPIEVAFLNSEDNFKKGILQFINKK